jgi:hypothetical protein
MKMKSLTKKTRLYLRIYAKENENLMQLAQKGVLKRASSLD